MWPLRQASFTEHRVFKVVQAVAGVTSLFFLTHG